MARWTKAWKIGGGLLAAGVAAAAVVVLRERGTEQPDFALIEEDGAIQLRDYPALLVAETSIAGERETALGKGFRRLADFIFAKRRGDASGDEKIAMTAPVLGDRHAGQWRTRFVMPAAYSEDTLPRPAGEVSIARLPQRRLAALRFTGAADDATLFARERELRDWLLARHIVPMGAAEYAYYNSPFVPAPLRRNEILIPVTRR
ncbi:MAG: heme-binding protein [Sphingomonas taxi]